MKITQMSDVYHSEISELEDRQEELAIQLKNLSEIVLENSSSNKCTTIHDLQISNKSTEDSTSLINHDFSRGLHSWDANDCDAYVLPEKDGIVAITNRREYWHGLEKDITHIITKNSVYSVCALVGVSEVRQGFDIRASLKLQYEDSTVHFLSIGRLTPSDEQWHKLEGAFCLASQPRRAVFCVDGPEAGVDLVIKSVEISRSNPFTGNAVRASTGTPSSNIILNNDFSHGLALWYTDFCDARVVSDETGYPSELSHMGCRFALLTNRNNFYSSLRQDITGRVSTRADYTICALVSVSSGGKGTIVCHVQATIKLTYSRGHIHHVHVGRTCASAGEWAKLEGKFCFSCGEEIERVEFYIEGPSPGVDILIKSVKMCSIYPCSP